MSHSEPLRWWRWWWEFEDLFDCILKEHDLTLKLDIKSWSGLLYVVCYLFYAK